MTDSVRLHRMSRRSEKGRPGKGDNRQGFNPWELVEFASLPESGKGFVRMLFLTRRGQWGWVVMD